MAPPAAKRTRPARPLFAALRFAALGCRILPATGKNPGGYLGTEWQHKATRDPDLIAAWWRAWPRANIAVLPDRALLPLDVDDPASFARFQAEHGDAPRTPRYLTGGDGGRERLLFAFPGAAALEHAGRMLAPGVQLRYSHNTNLVCIVPPGRNPDTGRELRWTIGLDEPRAPFPPAWLQAAVASPSNGTGRGEHQAPVERVPHGQRHPYLTDWALRLLRGGITDVDTIEFHLAGEFERACVLLPPPEPGYFESLAKWAVESRIAGRERDRADLAALIEARNERKRT